MRYLSVSQIVQINAQILGEAKVRDVKLLESATARPQQTVLEKEAYPTIMRKASALIHSLIQNHPFVDGNKRTAFIATVVFLELNGYKFKAEQEEVVKFMLDIANNKLDLQTIEEWLKEHLEKA
jgi:death-on-curing protein